VNLVGAFLTHKFKIPISFKSAGKQSKIKEKQEFLRKIGF